MKIAYCIVGLFSAQFSAIRTPNYEALIKLIASNQWRVSPLETEIPDIFILLIALGYLLCID